MLFKGIYSRNCSHNEFFKVKYKYVDKTKSIKIYKEALSRLLHDK